MLCYVTLRYVTLPYVVMLWSQLRLSLVLQVGEIGLTNYSDLRMLSYYFSLGGKDAYRIFMSSLCPVCLFYQSIVDLMDVLEQRKHEAILFTFKQVFFVPT